MQIRSSSKLTHDQTSNPTSSTNTTPKGRNRKSSKQKVENSNLEEHLSPIVTMADNRTMAEMLRAPTEGNAEAIVVPLIFAEQFELKHSLINMMTTDQFFRLEKDNPHDHICWFNKITSTIKYRDVPNSSIKMILFPFSLTGAARRWLEKEPPRTTWDDLVSKFINEFFPPQELQISIMKSQIFNNGSMNLFIRLGIDIKSPSQSANKCCDYRYDGYAQTIQATPHPTPVKAVEEICVTCGGAYPYYQCLATGGNTFSEFRDNIQGYVSAAAVNYNQVANPKSDVKAITTRSGVSYDGPSILPPMVENEPEATKDTVIPTNNGNIEDVQPQVVKSKSPVSTSEPANTPVSASKPNPQASIPYPSRRNDERNREKAKDQIEKFYQIFKDMSFEISFADALILMPKFASTLKALIGNKEKLSEMARTLNEHCSMVLLKKLPEKLGDPGKFLIPCDFLGMAECLALADLDASINLMPYSVWKKLSPVKKWPSGSI
nr:reverse transcriptase domain-containing protein [Tanacetum cinerariifolium]